MSDIKVDMQITGLDELMNKFKELRQYMSDMDGQEVNGENLFVSGPFFHDTRESAEAEQKDPVTYQVIQHMDDNIGHILGKNK